MLNSQRDNDPTVTNKNTVHSVHTSSNTFILNDLFKDTFIWCSVKENEF